MNNFDICLYTDGLADERKVGASAVMYKQGALIKLLRYHLGSVSHHTVFEAEAVGVQLRLHLAMQAQDCKSIHVRVRVAPDVMLQWRLCGITHWQRDG
jgi:hypothetical protein